MNNSSRYQALRVETTNTLYFSAHIIRLLHRVAVKLKNLCPSLSKKHEVLEKTTYHRIQVRS